MPSRLLGIIVVVVIVAPKLAPADDVKFDFGTPRNTLPVPVEMQFLFPHGILRSVPLILLPGLNAVDKRDAIASALGQYGLTVANTPLDLPTLTITNLPKGTRVQFLDHGTGERPDKITLPPPGAGIHGPTFGSMDYFGYFDPLDSQDQPAVFTAGIVTDVGELVAEVTSQELGFQTDGPIICQALFQRLAPQAPQYGAQINYAGDRLEVYFDPAYTVTQGGIIFGNTSRQGDSGGTLFVPPPADPPPVEFTFSQPLTLVPAQVMLQFTLTDGSAQNTAVLVDPGDTPLQKRDKAVVALNETGAAASPSAADKCVTGNLAPGSAVRLTDMGSCEASDSITSRGTSNAAAGFPGFFNPFAPDNQPAVFTAGIVTDVGELTAEVTAQDLGFQTDGPIICQALFDRLAPQAPQYGAQINYAGDRLEIYFDPAYTVTQGGIIFGTTSPSPGNYGEIVLPPVPPVLGDMNCDGLLDDLDIPDFVDAITSPQTYESEHPDCDILNGDMNGDGLVDGQDIGPFMGAIFSSGRGS